MSSWVLTLQKLEGKQTKRLPMPHPLYTKADHAVDLGVALQAH